MLGTLKFAGEFNEEAASPAELVARFTNEELYDAAHETSRKYEGIVPGHAIRIVKRRTDLSCKQFAANMHTSRSAVNRWMTGSPVSEWQSRKVFVLLLLVLEENGCL